MPTLTQKNQTRSLSMLQSLSQWIDATQITEERQARRIVKLIPATCPLKSEIRLWGRVILRIPALCKLNPLYEQLMTLRFRAMSFLADHCSEDISSNCT